jgi:hypothetical protein
MDEWLGRCLLPSIYQERLNANYNCLIFLPQHPVIQIDSVNQISPPTCYGFQSCQYVWNGQQAIEVGIPGLYEVVYRAGLSNISPVFGRQQYLIVKKLLQEGLGILGEPTKTITSVGLPGGLSQSFRRGSESTKVGTTILDELMLPLFRWKRKVVI